MQSDSVVYFVILVNWLKYFRRRTLRVTRKVAEVNANRLDVAQIPVD